MDSNSDPELTLCELCQRADSEDDFDKLMELAGEIQRRLNARQYTFRSVHAIQVGQDESD